MFMMFKTKNKYLRAPKSPYRELESGESESEGGFNDEVSVESLPPENVISASENMQPEFDSPLRKGTIFSGVFNIVCTSLDGTTLTIPYVIAKSGIIIGPLIIALFALSTILTLEAICICARKMGATTYPGVADRLLGKTSRTVFSVMLLLILFAVVVGFLILMRQIGTNIVIFLTGYELHPTLVMLGGAAISFPIMMRTNLFQLRYACYLSCFSVVCLLINMAVVVSFPVAEQPQYVLRHLRLWPASYLDVVESIPIVAMLYLSHFNILGVLTQLREPTQQRMNRIIYSAQILLAVIFTAFGVVGYLVFVAMFDNQYSDNMLIIFGAHDSNVIFGRVMLFVTVICTIPVDMVPSRDLVYEINEDVRGPATRLMASIQRHCKIFTHPCCCLRDWLQHGHSQHYYAAGAVQQHLETAQQFRHYGSCSNLAGVSDGSTGTQSVQLGGDHGPLTRQGSASRLISHVQSNAVDSSDNTPSDGGKYIPDDDQGAADGGDRTPRPIIVATDSHLMQTRRERARATRADRLQELKQTTQLANSSNQNTCNNSNNSNNSKEQSPVSDFQDKCHGCDGDGRSVTLSNFVVVSDERSQRGDTPQRERDTPLDRAVLLEQTRQCFPRQSSTGSPHHTGGLQHREHATDNLQSNNTSPTPSGQQYYQHSDTLSGAECSEQGSNDKECSEDDLVEGTPPEEFDEESVTENYKNAHYGRNGTSPLLRRYTRYKPPGARRLKNTVKDAVLTLVILSLAFVVALLIPDSVSVVWKVAGSLICMTVAIFVPAVLYIRLRDSLKARQDVFGVLCYAAAAISVPLIVVCTYFNVAALFA